MEEKLAQQFYPLDESRLAQQFYPLDKLKVITEGTWYHMARLASLGNKDAKYIVDHFDPTPIAGLCFRNN